MAGMRSRHRYHCRECRRRGSAYRFTLGHSLAWFKIYRTRAPVCPRCKTTDFYSFEKIRQKAQKKYTAKRPICKCSGVPHPHGINSHKLCMAYDGRDTTSWTGQDFDDYSKRLFEPKNGKHQRTTFI